LRDRDITWLVSTSVSISISKQDEVMLLLFSMSSHIDSLLVKSDMMLSIFVIPTLLQVKSSD